MATNRYDLQIATLTLLLVLAIDTQALGIKRALAARQDDNPGGPDGPGDGDDASTTSPISSAPTAISTATSPISTSQTTVGVTAPSTTPSPTTASSTIGPSPTSTFATKGGTMTKGSTSGGSEPESDLDGGSKGGIVLGVVLAVLFLGAATFTLVRFFRRRRQLRHRNSRTARDPGNPHPISARNVGPTSGRGDSEQSSLATTAASSRPWFDVGVGSAELSAETRETAGAGFTGRWVTRNPELAAPTHTVPSAGQPSPATNGHQFSSRPTNTELTMMGTAIHEMPDARGSRLSPAELPGSAPEEGRESISGREEGLVRNVSLRMDPTWDSSTNTWMSTSPSADTSMPEQGLEELVSPCSPCESHIPWREDKL